MPDAPVDDAPDADRLPDLGGLQVSLRRAVHVTIRGLADPHGLTVEDFGLLNAIRIRGPGSIRQLARALNYDPTSVSRQAFRLTEEGLLNSERSSEDRRIVTLSLTERGATLTRDINEQVEDSYRQLLDGSNPDDLEGFVNTIQRIRTNFRSMNSD